MLETRPPVLHGDFLACNAFNMMDELPRVKTRTLILCGAEDAMTPLKFSEALRDGIPGAQLEIVPEAGHMSMLEQPDAVAKSLEQFLNTF
jgi:pimeloyl-ACP methyl ester carboxylesterase